MEYQFSAISSFNKRLSFKTSSRWCFNDTGEHIFFIAKVFTLQELTITLRDNVNEMPVYFSMPSCYTIDDMGAKSVVVKTSSNEKM
jgi:hypothetical protein